MPGKCAIHIRVAARPSVEIQTTKRIIGHDTSVDLWCLAAGIQSRTLNMAESGNGSDKPY